MSAEKTREELLDEISSLRAKLNASEEAERVAWDGQTALGHLIDNLPGMAYRVVYQEGKDSQIEFLSSGTELLTGFPAGHIISEPSFFEKHIVHPEEIERRRNIVRAAMERRQPYDLRYRLVTSSGTIRWVAERGVCLFDDRGNVLAREGFIHEIGADQETERGVSQDIEDLRERLASCQREREACERQQQALHRHLRQSQRLESLGTLALGLAHDFNNILQAVIGYGKVALSEVDEGTPVERHVHRILDAAERARELTMRLLTFCGEGAPCPEPQLLLPLIEDASRMLRSVLPATIRLDMDVFPEPGPVVGDSTLLLQVFVTLATIAARQIGVEGGSLEFHLAEHCQDGSKADAPRLPEDGLYTRVTVGERQAIDDSSDRGYPWGDSEGISQSEPGLAVVHSIVQEMGGVFSVWHSPSGHPVFRVYFPVSDEEYTTPAPATPTHADCMDDFPSDGERVLFVDDEQILVELGTLVCEELGYQVTACRSSLEALELFEDDPASFDVVLTDQTMPDLTGFELAQRMLSIRPDIPVLLTTGYSEMVDEVRAREIGIREYLMKPLTPEALAAALRRVLDQ
jgi:CheY-like chemotaxis protein/signal transduction histidine kinase